MCKEFLGFFLTQIMAMPVNDCINIIFNSRIHYCRDTLNAKLRLVHIAGTIQVHSHRSPKHLRTPIFGKISYGRSIIETRPKLMPPITDTFQYNRITLFIHQLRTSHTQTGQLLCSTFLICFFRRTRSTSKHCGQQTNSQQTFPNIHHIISILHFQFL